MKFFANDDDDFEIPPSQARPSTSTSRDRSQSITRKKKQSAFYTNDDDDDYEIPLSQPRPSTSSDTTLVHNIEGKEKNISINNIDNNNIHNNNNINRGDNNNVDNNNIDNNNEVSLAVNRRILYTDTVKVAVLKHDHIKKFHSPDVEFLINMRNTCCRRDFGINNAYSVGFYTRNDIRIRYDSEVSDFSE